MTCNCLADLDTELREKHDTDVVHISHQYIECAYRKYTKKGVLSERWTHTGRDWRFCPLCGKPNPERYSSYARRVQEEYDEKVKP